MFCGGARLVHTLNWCGKVACVMLYSGHVRCDGSSTDYQCIRTPELVMWCTLCYFNINRYLMHYKTIYLHITIPLFLSGDILYSVQQLCINASKDGRLDLMDKCMATVAELWVLCDDTCTKSYTHHLLPLLEAPPPNCVKPPKRTIRQAACQLRSATLYFTGGKNPETKEQIKCKSKVRWSSKAAVWSRLMRLSKCAHWRKRLLLAHTIHVFLECMAQPMADICLIHGITMETVRSNHSFVEDDSQRSALCQWHLWMWARFSLLLLVTQIGRNVWSNPELVMFGSWTGSLLHEPRVGHQLVREFRLVWYLRLQGNIIFINVIFTFF